MTHAGLPHESHHTYAGVVGLLHAAVRRRLLDPAREPFTGAAHLALPLFETGRVGAHGEFPLLHGLHWLCAELCEDNPVVLLADDVQWFDQPSLRALTYLAERASDLPLLLVVAERSGEDPSSTALQELGERASAVLEPQPLSPRAVARLAHDSSEAGLPPSAAVVDEVVRRSGGNPFLANELLHLHAADPQAALATATPDSIVTTTEQRLRATSDLAREVAEVVAVLGATARVHDIATTLGAGVTRSAGHRRPHRTRRARDQRQRRVPSPADPRRSPDRPADRPAARAHRPRCAVGDESNPPLAAALLVESAPLAPLREDWVVPALLAAAEAHVAARARPRRPATWSGPWRSHSTAPPSCRSATPSAACSTSPATPRHSTTSPPPTVCAPSREASTRRASPSAMPTRSSTSPSSSSPPRSAVRPSRCCPRPPTPRRCWPWRRRRSTPRPSSGSTGAARAALEQDVADADSPGQRAVLAHVAWDAAARGSRPHGEVSELATRAIGDGAADRRGRRRIARLRLRRHRPGLGRRLRGRPTSCRDRHPASCRARLPRRRRLRHLVARRRGHLPGQHHAGRDRCATGPGRTGGCRPDVFCDHHRVGDGGRHRAGGPRAHGGHPGRRGPRRRRTRHRHPGHDAAVAGPAPSRAGRPRQRTGRPRRGGAAQRAVVVPERRLLALAFDVGARVAADRRPRAGPPARAGGGDGSPESSPYRERSARRSARGPPPGRSPKAQWSIFGRRSTCSPAPGRTCSWPRPWSSWAASLPRETSRPGGRSFATA